MKSPGSPGLRLLAGLTALVLIAHALVLQEASLSLSPGDGPPPAVAMSTRTVPPPPVAEPAPTPPPRPPAAPKAPKPPRPPKPAATTENPPAAPVFQSNLPDPSAERSVTATDSVANAATASAEVSPPQAAASAPAAAASAPSEPPPVDGATLTASVPASVRLLYNLEGQARNLLNTRRWMQNHHKINVDDPAAVQAHYDGMQDKRQYGAVMALNYIKKWPQYETYRKDAAALEKEMLASRTPVPHVYEVRPAGR